MAIWWYMYSSKIAEIKTVFKGLQTLYETYLPKADPILVHDLLLREQENPNVAPFYMVEVFTKPGTDSEAKRELIFNKTGMIPAIYDNGTHSRIPRQTLNNSTTYALVLANLANEAYFSYGRA